MAFSATNIVGNAVAGAAIGAGSQAASNAFTGDNGSVGAAAIGGAGGGAMGSVATLAARGAGQLLSDSTGMFIGNSSGQVTTPLAKQGTRESVGEVIGSTLATTYDKTLSCGVDRNNCP